VTIPFGISHKTENVEDKAEVSLVPFIEQKNILIAEDDPVSRFLLVKVIEKLGHQVVIAKTGIEAMEVVERIKVDMIFMDIQMPEMDGVEATKLIREKSGDLYKHLPIIAVTAYAMKGEKEKLIKAGLSDYITKPIPLEAIAELIKKWMT
jgi:two-component system, sensor histidine kinase